jgi:hypothetical protein
MSGTFPTLQKPADIKISSFTPTLVSQTHSLKRQVRRRGGHRWSITINYPPLLRSEFAAIYAFCVAQRGQFGSFIYVPPLVSTRQVITGGNGVVNGAHSAGDNTIVTDGWDASETCLKAGDFLKFDGHDKVYMIVEDLTSDGSGNATMTIEPPLMADLADDEDIVVDNVPFTVALTSDMQEYSAGAPEIYNFSVSFVEVI